MGVSYLSVVIEEMYYATPYCLISLDITCSCNLIPRFSVEAIKCDIDYRTTVCVPVKGVPARESRTGTWLVLRKASLVVGDLVEEKSRIGIEVKEPSGEDMLLVVLVRG